MSVEDLQFKITASGEVIFDPLQVLNTSPIDVTVTNFGSETLSNLGLYLVTTTNLGDVDNPADFPPETDYQDLLEMGTSTVLGLQPEGGLKVSVPQNGGGVPTIYFTRSAGGQLNNKIPFVDLAPGASATFTLTLETPPSVSSRRLFINVVLE